MMNLLKFCNRFVRQLLTKQATYQQKLQSFSFFVGALRIYHLFRCQYIERIWEKLLLWPIKKAV